MSHLNHARKGRGAFAGAGSCGGNPGEAPLSAIYSAFNTLPASAVSNASSFAWREGAAIASA